MEVSHPVWRIARSHPAEETLPHPADKLLMWSLQISAEPESQSKGWGCTYLLGETAYSISSQVGGGEPGVSVGPRGFEPLAAPGWGRLVDHGVPGAAPQVGPRRSQLYPLPMAFVFLILCLLFF